MEWFKIFSSESEAVKRINSSTPQLLVINGTRIALAAFNGKFFAVQDACTHNSESLSKGKVNPFGEIICPWHGYRFDLHSGQAQDSSCPSLKTYPVKIDETGFYVGIV
jgi:nitrite reductase/ring-hydroxylating ferredoxin subunit